MHKTCLRSRGAGPFKDIRRILKVAYMAIAQFCAISIPRPFFQGSGSTASTINSNLRNFLPEIRYGAMALAI